MANVRKTAVWCVKIVFGSALFALGFSLFLEPHSINAGGLSGLGMIAVHLLGFGTVGTLVGIVNLPLTVLGGLKVNKRFFVGTLVGMLTVSGLIDLFALLPVPQVDILTASVYGGVVCGLGLGTVFLVGASTGGSDVVVRLLKLRCRNAPLGAISMCFDLVIVLEPTLLRTRSAKPLLKVLLSVDIA